MIRSAVPTGLRRWIVVPALVVATAACGDDGPDLGPGPAASSDVTDPSEEAGMIAVTGSITYRERIALTPGTIATISLQDVSLADAPAEVVAEQIIELDDQQVPIPFELRAEAADLDPDHTYAVRATLTDADGALRWTTDTVYPVDPAQPATDLGELVMVRATGDG